MIFFFSQTQESKVYFLSEVVPFPIASPARPSAFLRVLEAFSIPQSKQAGLRRRLPPCPGVAGHPASTEGLVS